MLLELHNTLQRLLYDRGQISPREVDIMFEAPTRERVDKLTRPTINMFLFDLQENIELRQSNFETTRNNGRAERRQAPRRFDLRYMVSVLTTEVEDEHQLLWRVLLTLVRHPQFPAEVLSDELRVLEPALTTQVSRADEGQRVEHRQGRGAIEGETNQEGHYVLHGVPSGPIRLHVTGTDGSQKIVPLEVPAPHAGETLDNEKSSYDIVLEAAAT